jgi:serine/threonine protein phosphatase PrpC
MSPETLAAQDITVRRPIKWVSTAATDVGTVRAVNEDAVMARPEIGLWAVADGMGGHEAGNVASRMIAEALADIPKRGSLSDYVTAIEDRILDANHRLLEYSEIVHDGRVVGSTVVSLLIHGPIGVCLWMGDSRLYRYRGNEFAQISRDHSEVSELLQAGAITEEEAVNHPNSNVITRAVGTGEEAYLDLDVFDVQVGDIFLLCSDGLYNAVDRNSIVAHLGKPDTAAMADGLINNALANGATDNVSVVVIKGVRQPSAGNVAGEKQ